MLGFHTFSGRYTSQVSSILEYFPCQVVVRMVSRWCNMFIKNKVQEQGYWAQDSLRSRLVLEEKMRKRWPY